MVSETTTGRSNAQQIRDVRDATILNGNRSVTTPLTLAKQVLNFLTSNSRKSSLQHSSKKSAKIEGGMILMQFYGLPSFLR